MIDDIRWMLQWGSKSLYFALNYQARANDLFIVTYPRSGTTWMQNTVYNLQTDGQPFDKVKKHFFKHNPCLETDGKQGLDIIQSVGAIKTHLPMNRVSHHPLAKYICVVRNPKDVCVSYSIFFNMLGDVPKLRFDQFFQYFFNGCLPFNDYFQVLHSVWDVHHRDNVLLVSYEEMRTDLRSVVHKVSSR
jgi:hypothetical protein